MPSVYAVFTDLLVSLTSIVVKTLVHNRLTDFLSKYNKLVKYQHGFQKGHSCQTQLLSTIHEWAMSIIHKASSHIIFLDFSKAFDSVPHRRLLLKLEHIGVRGTLLHWVRGFLSNREQRVIIDGQMSDWARVTFGVPQGPILGQLLFLIYVNDTDSDISSSVRLFADDCVIYQEVRNTVDVELTRPVQIVSFDPDMIIEA